MCILSKRPIAPKRGRALTTGACTPSEGTSRIAVDASRRDGHREFWGKQASKDDHRNEPVKQSTPEMNSSRPFHITAPVSQTVRIVCLDGLHNWQKIQHADDGPPSKTGSGWVNRTSRTSGWNMIWFVRKSERLTVVTDTIYAVASAGKQAMR